MLRRSARRLAAALDREDEEVAQVAGGRIHQDVQHIFLARAPGNVDVAGRPRRLAQPEVEREAALEHPCVGRDHGEAR